MKRKEILKHQLNFAFILLTIINEVADNGPSSGLTIADNLLTPDFEDIDIDTAFNILGYRRPA